MAFTQVGNRIPTAIGEITVSLHDPDGVNGNRTILGHVVVMDQDGVVLRVWDGDLQPHLSGPQLSALASFLDALRTQAEAQLL